MKAHKPINCPIDQLPTVIAEDSLLLEESESESLVLEEPEPDPEPEPEPEPVEEESLEAQVASVLASLLIEADPLKSQADSLSSSLL